MDDLGFYILLNSISVISGGQSGDYGRLLAGEPRVRLERYQAGLKTGNAIAVGQHFNYLATRSLRSFRLFRKS